jgi:hypothetical protein
MGMDSGIGSKPVASWRRVLEITSFALIVCGLAALTLVENVSRTILPAFALLLIPAAILSSRPNSTAYGRAWNWATILFLIASLATLRWTLTSSIQTLAHLCCFLQLHRAFNYRLRRHYFQIWMLTVMMFLLVPLANEIPPPRFGLFLLLFFLLSMCHYGTLGLMADSTGGGSVERDRYTATLRAESGFGPLAALRRFLGSGAGILAKCWTRLAVGGISVTLLLFFLLPRPPLPPALRDAESAEASRARQSLLTGFTQSIDLGQLSSLRLDPTVAVRVRNYWHFRMESCRLRAGTMDYFDGDRWVRLSNPTGPLPLRRHSNAPEYRLVDDALLASLRGHLRPAQIIPVQFPFRLLLKLPGTVGIGGLQREVMLEDDNSLSFTGKSELGQYVLYLAEESLLRELSGAMACGGPPTRWHTQIPTHLDGEWLSRRALSLCEEATGDLERARKIEIHFRREGEYTRELGMYSGRDGRTNMRTFLQARHPRGHCELFATGMALLTRAQGIPSRVVTGFQGGETEESSGDVLLRYQDAHAWVEVWIADRGWVSFDPTPAFPLVNFSDRLPFLQLRKWSQGFLRGWNRMAANPGTSPGQSILAKAARKMEPLAHSIVPSGLISRLGRQLRESLREPSVLGLALILLLFNGAAAWGFHHWRRRRKKQRLPARSRGAKGWGDAWEAPRRALLRVAGVEGDGIPTGTTLGERLVQAMQRRGGVSPPLAAALALYEKGRFGTGSWTLSDEKLFRMYLLEAENSIGGVAVSASSYRA